jgi:hypothetical protein
VGTLGLICSPILLKPQTCLPSLKLNGFGRLFFSSYFQFWYKVQTQVFGLKIVTLVVKKLCS